MQEPSLRSNCQRPSQPLLPRHGWAALPPQVITALPPTHTQEMKYSSRTYWLLQRLLGKVNETGWGKEMSVSLQGVGGSEGKGWAVTSSLATLGFSSLKSVASSILGALSQTSLASSPMPGGPCPLESGELLFLLSDV